MPQCYRQWLYIWGFTKFGIKVLWRLQLLEYLRTLSLKVQKAQTKIEVVLSLPCWLSQLNWDRLRTTSILVRAFWNSKCKVLKYSRTCSLHNTLIPNLVKPLEYILISFFCFRAILFNHIIGSLKRVLGASPWGGSLGWVLSAGSSGRVATRFA